MLEWIRRWFVRRRHDGCAVTVNFFVDAFDAATGAPLGRRLQVHNLVTDPGLNVLRDYLKGEAVGGLSHFALGTGATAVTPSMTALPNEAYRDVWTQRIAEERKLIAKYYLGSLFGNGLIYTKAGAIINGGATLFAAVEFPDMEKTNAEAWTFTWEFTLADANR